MGFLQRFQSPNLRAKIHIVISHEIRQQQGYQTSLRLENKTFETHQTEILLQITLQLKNK